jgi:hypothetical protein
LYLHNGNLNLETNEIEGDFDNEEKLVKFIERVRED